MKNLNVQWLFLALCIASSSALAYAQTNAAEKRCGWISNPTPGNWSLHDADGEWVLSAQGSGGVGGLDDLPDFTVGEWVVSNGTSYGHGCACMDMVTANGVALSIANITQIPLVRCKDDPKLKPIIE